jgi:hypothetical protein
MDNPPVNESQCINWNQYYTECTAGEFNPFSGAISFDNIGLAWVAIFLVYYQTFINWESFIMSDIVFFFFVVIRSSALKVGRMSCTLSKTPILFGIGSILCC